MLHIAEAQETIRWIGIFRGRLSQQWGDHQQINGQTWSAALSELFIHQWHLLWLERNGDHHGRDKASRDAATRKQALPEVEQLYEYKGWIQLHLNWILDPPLEICIARLDQQFWTDLKEDS